MALPPRMVEKLLNAPRSFEDEMVQALAATTSAEEQQRRSAPIGIKSPPRTLTPPIQITKEVVVPSPRGSDVVSSLSSSIRRHGVHPDADPRRIIHLPDVAVDEDARNFRKVCMDKLSVSMLCISLLIQNFRDQEVKYRSTITSPRAVISCRVYLPRSSAIIALSVNSAQAKMVAMMADDASSSSSSSSAAPAGGSKSSSAASSASSSPSDHDNGYVAEVGDKYFVELRIDRSWTVQKLIDEAVILAEREHDVPLRPLVRQLRLRVAEDDGSIDMDCPSLAPQLLVTDTGVTMFALQILPQPPQPGGWVPPHQRAAAATAASQRGGSGGGGGGRRGGGRGRRRVIKGDGYRRHDDDGDAHSDDDDDDDNEVDSNDDAPEAEFDRVRGGGGGGGGHGRRGDRSLCTRCRSLFWRCCGCCGDSDEAGGKESPELESMHSA